MNDNEVLIKFDSKDKAQEFMQDLYYHECEFWWKKGTKVTYDSENQIINIEEITENK